ncbi:MFS transporter [Streptomyces sp. NPDC058623]|uniref:MFS transporter n=1 Tax=Streptomyces sp. NPDC058623 TaxID=3346563 RepID=UPI003669B0EB
MTRKQAVMAGLLLGTTFLMVTDFSVLNVAIPVIGSELGLAVDDWQWIATSFALTAAGFSLLFGRVADIVGRRRLFLTGIGVLVLSSLVGGLTDHPGVLIAARMAQGLATAMATPAALALLTTAYPEGPLRAKVLGLNGVVISTGFTTGAVLGGLLTDLISWRAAFLLNVPIGLVLLVLAPRVLAESRASVRPRLDVWGAVTVSTGLVCLVVGVTRIGHETLTDPVTLLFLAAAVVLLITFWLVEQRTASPLVSPAMMRRPTIRGGNLAAFTTVGMQTAVVFLMVLYLQEVLELSAIATGLALSVLGAACFFGGMLAPRIAARFGPRNALLGGLTLQAASAAGLVLSGGSRGSLAIVLAVLCVGGFGHLVTDVSAMITATSGLPNDEQGLATGLATMTRQVAMTVGIPVISTIATARAQSLRATGTEAADATLSGVQAGLLANAAIVLATIALVAFLLRTMTSRGRPKAPSRQEA